MRPYVQAPFKALGTDGFGRSDYRRRLRSFFEVDRYHVVVASLKALADDQLLPSKRVADAIAQVRHRPRGPEPGAQLNRGADPTRNFKHILRRGRQRRWRKLMWSVPDIGDFHDVPVIEVLVKPGDDGRRSTSRW